ncbi:MAG: hypothetical protein ACLR8G_07535 [Faecalibacterium prausnitzii]
MQRKDLALRVLSTAAIMSIVTSIAAPAFAGTYYIGKGSIDVEAITDADGKQYVHVTQNGETHTDTSDEIVIKDGTDENDTTLKDAERAAATPAVAPAAGAATQEATGSADAAGESQPDPDDAFTLNETEEDSAQTSEGNNPTEDTPDPSTEPPKKDVVYEYAPADPEPEQQATKLTLSTSPAPTAETREATLAATPAAAPTAATPTAGAVGSADNPTTNVIKVVNNWAKELKIRLSNVNIKVGNDVTKAAMDVSGGGTTKVELDGQNALDSSSSWHQAGLRKQGEGTLIITDETDDRGNKITAPKSESDNSGSLFAEGGGPNGAAGIGGNVGESTENITIEGYATVNAKSEGWGAGIGGGGNGHNPEQSGDAENIIIQGHSKVTATALNGAAIGGGSPGGGGRGVHGGSARGIVIRDHATVIAKGSYDGWTGNGAAIGAAGLAGDDTVAEVTIGTAGPKAADEDVNIIATGFYGSAIGNGKKKTTVIIQGHVTIQTASSRNYTAIGSGVGDVTVNITDNVTIDTVDEAINVAPDFSGSSIGGGTVTDSRNRKVEVTIDGGDNGRIEIGKKSAITGLSGAISGTEVNIGNNVLLKMKQKEYWHDWSDSRNPYINVNGAEAAVGTRDNPGAGGLVIGDNTELWYSAYGAYGRLQKIVHGKNVCKKSPTEHIKKDPSCITPGSADYTCDYEHTNGAADPSCNRTWTDELPALGHDWKDNGDANHICDRDHVTAAHTYGEWTTVKEATCTAAGQKQHTCTECGHVETEVIPATGHHWVDKGDGTHTCPDCGATEGQPFNTNSALELRVVDAEGMDQPFTVSQNGTLRTYTGAYDIATLTGDLDTLRYLQDHGAQTIQFVTNGQTSSFAINDLLAQGSGSEVFYLTHRGAEEPTLLLVEADHSELVKD